MHSHAVLTACLAASVLAAPVPDVVPSSKLFTPVDQPGPNDWVAGDALYQKLIASYQGNADEYDFPKWIGHVIGKCNEAPACTTVSVYAMTDDTSGKLVWHGETYAGGRAFPEDFKRQHAILHSQAWSVVTPP